MNFNVNEILTRLKKVFNFEQAVALSEVIYESYKELAKASDLRELKEVVENLVKAQAETEKQIKVLTEAQARTEKKVQELAEAQARTEKRVQELAEAQAKTEKKIGELTEAQLKTEKRVETLFSITTKLSQDLGGLSRSVSYGFENEVYRLLPRYLKENYQIEIKERFIRKKIDGEEINLLGHGIKNGITTLIVGEVKLRLDDQEYKGRRKNLVFEKLDKIALIASKYYKCEEVIKIIVTHFATDSWISLAKERGVILVCSFELS